LDGLFKYLILFPAIAIFGTIYALAVFSRLSARREWLDLPARDWRRVQIELLSFALCFPVFWLLSEPLWPVQHVAIPVFAIAMGLVGTVLGRRWLAMAQDPRP